ncbi:MAG: COG1361 S-layer family protein [Nanoarchaeota archaeon]
MKKLTILLLVLFALPLVLGLNTIIGSGPSLNTTLLRYDPVPAEPGDLLDVYVLVTNSGGSGAKNVKVEAVSNYPFSIDNTQDATKQLPNLPGQESFLVRYKVRVANDAPEGNANFKVKVTIAETSFSHEELLAIPIKGNNPVISVNKIMLTPATIHPGGEGKIDIYLKNPTDVRLRDISVSLSTQSTLGSTTSQLPFAPRGGSLEQRIVSMRPGEETTVSYNIITEPGATSDLYRIPVTIEFSDESGNNYTLSDQVGLIIQAEPSLQIYLDAISVYSDQPQGEITIKYVNDGLAKVKLLTTEIMPSDDFDLLSHSSMVYVGNIDSDDYETVTYTIKAKKTDKLNIPVRIHYLDAFNNPHDIDVTIPVTLITKKEAGLGNGGISPILIVVIIAIIAFVVWRIIKRRKKR